MRMSYETCPVSTGGRGVSSQYGREGGGLLRGALPLRAPAPRQLLREACPLRLRLRRLRVRRARVWAERARL